MSRFLSYIHDLRGVAILFVVGVHARGTASDWVSQPMAHDLVASFFDAQEGNGTVMFLFIAGFLFQHLMHNGFDFKKYIWQKARFIILPYILISIPIILWRINSGYLPWSVDPALLDKPVVVQFIYHLVFGTHLSPFWFISAIVMFYLSSPLLHLLDKPFFYKYIFPVILIAGLFTFRPFNNGNPVLSYLHYLPVYLAGMWASYNKSKIFSTDLRYFWILTAIYIVLTVLDLNNDFAIANGASFEEVLRGHAFVFNFYLFRTILLCFMMTMLFYRFQFRRIAFLEVLGDYSFGVYFVHFLLLIAVRKILVACGVTLQFNIVTFLFFYVLMVMMSAGVVYLVRRIAGKYSRNLIGS